MPTKWVLQPQEQSGTYRFSGQMYMTATIANTIPQDTVLELVADVWRRVLENDGADYLQVFKNSETGDKIFVIDQLNQEMKQNNPQEWVKENDHFTILYAYEY